MFGLQALVQITQFAAEWRVPKPNTRKIPMKHKEKAYSSLEKVVWS
jgi:hypothetical protein